MRCSSNCIVWEHAEMPTQLLMKDICWYLHTVTQPHHRICPSFFFLLFFFFFLNSIFEKQKWSSQNFFLPTMYSVVCLLWIIYLTQMREMPVYSELHNHFSITYWRHRGWRTINGYRCKVLFGYLYVYTLSLRDVSDFNLIQNIIQCY